MINPSNSQEVKNSNEKKEVYNQSTGSSTPTRSEPLPPPSTFKESAQQKDIPSSK